MYVFILVGLVRPVHIHTHTGQLTLIFTNDPSLEKVCLSSNHLKYPNFVQFLNIKLMLLSTHVSLSLIRVVRPYIIGNYKHY